MFVMFLLTLFCIGFIFANGYTINQKNCLQELELVNAKQLLGAFRPRCNSDGTYEEVQCHEGYCYCVVPETGKEIEGTRLRFKEPKICKHPEKPTINQCLQDLENFNTNPLFGAVRPQCNNDGTYRVVQCHENYCYCVFPKTGEEILGTRLRSMLPRTCKHTECILSRHQGLKLTKLGLLGVPVPRCDEYGDYDTVQCRKVMCWCADIHTGKALGEAVPGTPNCHTIVS